MRTNQKEKVKMDEMKLKLSTRFMRGIVAKIASRIISKKLGFKPGIKLNEIDIEKKGDKIHLHVNVDAEIDEKDLLKIIRLANLEDDE